MKVRRVEVRTGLGGSVDAELEQHVVSARVGARGMTYTMYALYLRPSVGIAGNWSALEALGRALRAERSE